MSWSPYKETVVGYVSRNPGCSKWDVASHCTHNSQRNPSKQYYIVNTALKNGWIAGRQIGRQYRLYVPTPESMAKQAARRRNRPAKQPQAGRFAAMLADKRAQQLAAAAAEFRRKVFAGARALGLDLREGGYCGQHMYVPSLSCVTCMVPAEWLPFFAEGNGHIFADYLEEHPGQYTTEIVNHLRKNVAVAA